MSVEGIQIIDDGVADTVDKKEHILIRMIRKILFTPKTFLYLFFNLKSHGYISMPTTNPKISIPIAKRIML